MESDGDKWLKEKAEKFLKEVGIRKDQIVLDWGCGSGYYTIPTAKIVGDKGKVYALDKSRFSLYKVAQRAKSEKLTNIQTIKTSSKYKIPLEDDSVDLVLLYDVLHSYYFAPSESKGLIKEIYRVSKSNALISVYPKHMYLEDIKDELEKANFHFARKLFETLLHDRVLTQDYLLNFRRK